MTPQPTNMFAEEQGAFCHANGSGRPATPRAEARRFSWNEAKRTARDARSRATEGE